MGTLLVDLGNTRAKFAWVPFAAAPRSEWRVWSAPSGDPVSAELTDLSIDVVWICSVGPPELADDVRQQLVQRHPSAQVHRFRSSASVAGVRNRYVDPGRLGPDRLAAALGARAHVATGSVVIATFGTATTIDRLDADDGFDGGVILPGIGLMRRSLASGTAGLPVVEPIERVETHAGPGAVPWPRATEDAITEGILRAQLGALDRSIALDPAATVLLSGGDAPIVAARLDRPHRVVDNLVLDGLARIAFAPTSSIGMR